MPHFSYLLADQMAGDKAVARYLGVSPGTLARYKAAGEAPRPVMLALWFESRWGRSALHAELVNEAQHARAWVASLEREIERLRGVIARLEQSADWGAANAPMYRVS